MKRDHNNPPKSDWQYKSEDRDSQPKEAPSQSAERRRYPVLDEVHWTASEFVAHKKDFVWYLGLGVAAALLAVTAEWLTHDHISSVVIIVVAVCFGIVAGRQPRVLTYRLDDNGLTIGEKLYPYSDFKSFSVVSEGHFSSILFLPLKRFMPPITIYYEPKDENKIVQVLSMRLPMDQQGIDILDRFMHRIRF